MWIIWWCLPLSISSIPKLRMTTSSETVAVSSRIEEVILSRSRPALANTALKLVTGESSLQSQWVAQKSNRATSIVIKRTLRFSLRLLEQHTKGFSLPSSLHQCCCTYFRHISRHPPGESTVNRRHECFFSIWLLCALVMNNSTAPTKPHCTMRFNESPIAEIVTGLLSATNYKLSLHLLSKSNGWTKLVMLDPWISCRLRRPSDGSLVAAFISLPSGSRTTLMIVLH